MVYVTSDLHGYPLSLFQKFLEKVGFNSEDTLYVLGDVIDRGSDGIKILKWIMGQPNVKLLLGNHEAMMLDCEFLFDGTVNDQLAMLSGVQQRRYDVWTANGGYSTIDALRGTRDSEIRYIFDFLRKAPLYKEISVNGKKFILVHSGLGNFDENKDLSEYFLYDLVWTRPDIETRYFDDTIVVFGHTPTIYFNGQLGKIFKTDTWIDIDVGVGKGQNPALLRLDDLKCIYYNEV